MIVIVIEEVGEDKFLVRYGDKRKGVIDGSEWTVKQLWNYLKDEEDTITRIRDEIIPEMISNSEEVICEVVMREFLEEHEDWNTAERMKKLRKIIDEVIEKIRVEREAEDEML